MKNTCCKVAVCILLLVALGMWIKADPQGYFSPQRVEASFINAAEIPMTSLSVTIYGHIHRVSPLPPGGRLDIGFTPGTDSDYGILAEFSDSTILDVRAGYFTAGMANTDIFRITQNGVKKDIIH